MLIKYFVLSIRRIKELNYKVMIPLADGISDLLSTANSIKLSRPAHCLVLLSEIARVAPDVTRLHSIRAQSLLKLGRPNEALEAALKGVQSNCASQQYIVLAEAHIALGDFESALVAAQKCLDLESGSRQYLILSRILLAIGLYDEAAKAGFEAKRLNSICATESTYAKACIAAGMPSEAKKSAKKAIKFHSSSSTHALISRVHASNGQLKKALKAAMYGVTIARSNTCTHEPLLALAETQHQLREYHLAITTLDGITGLINESLHVEIEILRANCFLMLDDYESSFMYFFIAEEMCHSNKSIATTSILTRIYNGYVDLFEAYLNIHLNDEVKVVLIINGTEVVFDLRKKFISSKQELGLMRSRILEMRSGFHSC